MTNLGLMSYFLVLETKQNQDRFFICQKKYAKEILKKFHTEACKFISNLMNQKKRFCLNVRANKVDEG